MAATVFFYLIITAFIIPLMGHRFTAVNRCCKLRTGL